MTEIAVWRLYLLRAIYAFIALGLGVFLWPHLLQPGTHWTVGQGQETCMLAAFSLLCVLGLRYPLQLLPILLWEITWKTMWLALVPLPQWLRGHIDPAIQPAVFAVGMVALVYLAVPWDAVFRQYALTRGARWR